MAWEKRGQKCSTTAQADVKTEATAQPPKQRSYFYRSVRRNGRVVKEYYGCDDAARLAAEIDALRQAELQAARQVAREDARRVAAALAVTLKHSQLRKLLVAASMLVAGYHCPGRHSWRRWHNGRRILRSH